MPGLPSVAASSQGWASVGSMWSTSLNEAWLPEWRIGSTGGFTVPCSPSSSGYIFSSSGDGTTGTGNGYYALGRAVRVVQGASTIYGPVASASVAVGITTVGLSSSLATAALSTATAFTSVAVGTESGHSLAGSSGLGATKFHREDGTWAAATGELKEVGYAIVAADETTTSVTFVDLASAGPSVTMTCDLNDEMNCHGNAWHGNSGTNYNSIAPKLDADATAAADGSEIYVPVGTGGTVDMATYLKQFSGLSAASHTVKTQYNTNAGTGRWKNRKLVVYRSAG